LFLFGHAGSLISERNYEESDGIRIPGCYTKRYQAKQAGETSYELMGGRFLLKRLVFL